MKTPGGSDELSALFYGEMLNNHKQIASVLTEMF